VRPQGVHKGAFLDRVLASMLEHGKQADFVLVVGDDASDEYMFTAAEDYAGAWCGVTSCRVVPCHLTG
jgi:trehalose-6-phosphatase